MTNKGARAILRLPRMPERQLRFLIALETFTRRGDGWREAGTDLLAEVAGLSPRTVAKARRELAAASLIGYRRGHGRGHVSAYQVRLPGLAGDGLKVATEDATFKGGSVVATFTAPKGGNDVATFTQPERWQTEPVKVANEPDKGGKRNAVTRENSSEALKEIALEPSAARERAREAGPAVHSREEPRPEPARTDDQNFSGNGDRPRPAAQARGGLRTAADRRPGHGYGQCYRCRGWLPVMAEGRLPPHNDPGGGFCINMRLRPEPRVGCRRCGTERRSLAWNGYCADCDAALERAGRDREAGP
jgi:hypothetical protein